MLHLKISTIKMFARQFISEDVLLPKINFIWDLPSATVTKTNCFHAITTLALYKNEL